MPREAERDPFTRLVQKMDPQSTLLSYRELKGGVSAQVTLLEVRTAEGQLKKMIVRRHGEMDRQQNPRIAADEFRLLQVLRSAEVRVPAPLYLDDTGESFPEPCLVIEFIDGTSDVRELTMPEFLPQMTEHLLQIHQIASLEHDCSFLPSITALIGKKLAKRPELVDDSLDEGRIRDVLEAVWPLPQVNQNRLLHGDYWPGNLLWKDGMLVAILDWEDAAIGDPLADVANARLELLWAFGVEAMQAFTALYQKQAGSLDFAQLPYWDLVAALRPANQLSGWGLEPHIEKSMRERHRWFVDQAITKLPGR
ncbi:phosphotransferase family protein [Brevibacillus migulae]|uniref:phosphotransferase family protein n=1 Tax=Brevibacillus migulae TaxID=1644114 RepID=UPI00106EB1F8|nr:phosphotransferase [Brevibacillus migulae]